ncbi:InlB B-repeat-containing protein [Syntrophomonas erecta]
MVRERLLSVMLCLVFVMTMFPFSAAAESDHFVTEGDEQVISVSEDVYGEEDSDIDSGNYEDEQDNSEDVYEEQGNEGNDMDNRIVDNSLDDTDTSDELPMPVPTPAGANRMQIMEAEDNGVVPSISENPPIYGVSAIKTSYEFAQVTGYFEVRVPEEGDEEEYYTYCEVGFTPIIEEGESPFYIANGLYGPEAVFTIRDSDIYERATVDLEDINIEKLDLVEADEPRIIYEEYDPWFYFIIFEVDFYSKKVPNELIGTLRTEVQVYDSPLLAVEINNEEQISLHDDYDRNLYIDGDIWNSTVDVKITRESDDQGGREPVAGVLTNIYYYWGRQSSNNNKPYCIFRPTDRWETTNTDGIATFTIGSGDFLIEREIGVSGPALYGALVKGLGQDILWQYYTYPDLKDFEGIIEVKVVNTAGEPLEGRTVQFWGGAKYDGDNGGTTNEEGIAEIRYPYNTTSEDRRQLTMTELPTFELKWNLTQVIDNPSRIVKGHNAPLYLSPEIKVSEGYFKNPYTEIKGVKLQVYDVDNPEKTLIETSPMVFKEKYDPQRDIILRGSHRAYIKISPEDLAGKHLGIRAVVRNKDEGVRDKEQVRGYIEDPVSSHQLYEPKKEFTFAFVPLQVGSEENSSSISYGSLSKQKEFIRKVFPAPIKFVEKSPMFIAKPRFSTHNMYLSRIFRELDRTQKLFSDKYDLYVGMTPSGFLGAAGLQDSGMLGMNWSFFGAVHGAILIEPSKTLPHTTIHEFIHTLGFSDVYPSGDYKPLSANGHDGSPINNVAGRDPAYETIMYDSATLPWPTEGEYNALLEYATKPVTREKSFLRMNVFSGEAESEVLLLSGSIEDVRSNNRKIYFDPIIKHTGDVDINDDFVNNPYVIQTLDSNGEMLSQYFFSDYEYEGKYYANLIANLSADGVHAIEIGKQEYGRITQIFKRYEYSANAPVASITGPGDTSLSGDFMIAWEASDADRDALLSELQVSSDGGNTWDTIAADIPNNASGNYSYKLNAANFPKGTNYVFKVLVTDGMRSTEAVSSKYTIAGYEQKPILDLSATEVTVKVKPGTTEANAYFELENSGREDLNVKFLPADEATTLVSPLFIREYTIYPGQKQLIAIPLILPGETEASLAEVIDLQTNDPDQPTTNLTINVEYSDEDLKPDLATLATTPSDFKGGVSGSAIQVTFDAYATVWQSGLEATVIVEAENGSEILNEMMDENYHKLGAYTYYWEPEDLAAGNYNVYIGLKDPVSGLERDRTGYDFAFSIKAPNGPPVFAEPNSYENDRGVVNRGETITIPYQVSDPDGDSLDINLYSNLLEHGLNLIKDAGNSGRIEWTANVSGAHSIYLTATDPSKNSATVMFNITEIEDLNLFTISLEANSTEAGQVYGSGIYNPGEYVIAEAVPGASYKFISWTENGEVVSTDPVYTFKAAEDRQLVANFEEKAVFNYYLDNNEVIITGFADEDLQDIIVPNEIAGYPVTGINNMAFYSRGIKSVNFPNTLINIGQFAFGSNALTEVTIPNGVTTIGVHGFSNNQLSKVVFPNSVTTIAEYAFANNQDLAEVVIPNGDTALGEGVFSGYSQDLIIYGVPGSSTNDYATENSITFRDINEYGGDIPAKYSITVAEVIGGTATVTTNPAALAEEGATVTINIDGIQSGKQFKAITVTDADSNNVVITQVTAGKKYTFTMSAKPVTVSVELQDASIVVPEKYTLTLNGVGTDAAGAGEYAENDTVTINAGNRSGYTFKGWTSTDVDFANANAQITTFIMPAKNVTVTATWETFSGGGSSGGSSSGSAVNATTQYSVITNSEAAHQGNGQITLSSQQAKAGETVYITIEPDPGYENHVPTVLHQNGNPLTVTQNSDGTYSFQMPAGGVSIDTEYTKIDYFDDVDENTWYDEAAWFCVVHGLMAGTGERRFDGNLDTTRAMLVAVLYRLSQSEETAENIFPDVEEDKWYTEAITWAAKNNIVSGYGNGNFGPEDILTREQMIAILHQYSKFMGYDVSKKDDLGAYHDADYISDWAIAQMQWAVANGLITGVGNNLVSPQTGANRAQFAVIMQRYYTDFVERNTD